MKKTVLFALLLCFVLTGCVKQPARPAVSVAPDMSAGEPSQSEPVPEAPAGAEIRPAAPEPENQPEIPYSEDAPVQPEPVPAVIDELERIRDAAGAEGCLISVAYAGFEVDTLAEELNVAGIMAAFPCTEETAFVDAGGEEVYVLIPTDPEAKIRICSVTLTEDGELLPADDALYAGSGAPVILRCNVSDIVPNVIVQVEDSEGRRLDASPSLSLRDGSVSMEGAYDFTSYPEGFVREGN
ncbi:MAG: hypothetical protein IKQ73_05675 [Oscillospiraceae bacterium]|nr:hypothetical protein [Oscillospiraceae bacterium]